MRQSFPAFSCPGLCRGLLWVSIQTVKSKPAGFRLLDSLLFARAIKSIGLVRRFSSRFCGVPRSWVFENRRGPGQGADYQRSIIDQIDAEVAKDLHRREGSVDSPAITARGRIEQQQRGSVCLHDFAL